MSQLDYASGATLLTRRLTEFGAFRKRWTWFGALARFVVLGPGSLLALLCVDAVLPLPWWLLLALLAVAIGLTLYAAVRHAIFPLFGRVDVDREAVVVESLHGRLDNQIIGSLQLGREVARAQASGEALGYSTSLVNALITRTAENVGGLDLPKLVNRRDAVRTIQVAAAVVLIWAALAVAAPGMIGRRVDRVRDAYATLLDLLFPVDIRVTPGDVTLVRGLPVSLTVAVTPARRTGARLVRTNPKTRTVTTDDLTLSSGRATVNVPAANESFEYHFEYASRRSPTYKVLVGDLPAVAAMNTELSYPAYTGMPARTLIGRLPKLQALAGTGVLVSIASTVDLHPDLSHVTWQDGTRQPLSVSGRFAHFSFNVDRPERATIRLTGALGKGFEMPEPIGFEVSMQRDMPPTVDTLTKNKRQTMLAEEATHVSVNALAEDDFGVAEVLLDYRIDTIDPLLNRPTRQGTVSRLIEPARDRTKAAFPDLFKTLTPPLEPGDRITITVSAKDNNTETGPSLGRASPIEIVIVRPDLGAYVERDFGFGTDPLLGGLKRVQRATNLLIEAEKTAHTEAKAAVEKQDVKSRVGAEDWPGGAQDAVGDYFRLLSGEK
jgi:hypothetical protein